MGDEGQWQRVNDRLDTFEQKLEKCVSDIESLLRHKYISKGEEQAQGTLLQELKPLPERVAVLEAVIRAEETQAAHQQAWVDAWIGRDGYLRSTQFIALILVAGAAIGFWGVNELSALYGNAPEPAAVVRELEEALPAPPDPWGRSPAKD